jgi:hypothetical protein
MDDLIAFLRARLDEREAKARRAKPGPWFDDGGSVCATHPTDQVVDYTESAEHIAANDPEFVLADVDAKRRVIDEWRAEDSYGWYEGYRDAIEHVLQLLALPYAGHADYREKWRR